MFQIKNFASISASMINYLKATQNKITDFVVGSVARTLIEAPAIEIEELYLQMWLGLKEGIPTAIYQAFDFQRQPARSQQGSITVTVATGPALTIPKGTQFASLTTATGYVSMADVAIPEGVTSATVLVAANTNSIVQAIVAGNGFSAAIERLITAVAAHDFTPGEDEESDAARKARFIAYINTFARSPVASVEYGLTTVALKDANGAIIESVQQAAVVEEFLTNPIAPPGVIHCYLHNGVDGASADLIAEAIKVLNGYVDDNGNKVVGWKAAGIQVVIAAVEVISVTLAATLTPTSGFLLNDLIIAVSSELDKVIAGTGIGQKLIRAELIAAAMAVNGVDNFILTTPVVDVAISPNQKIIKGSYALG